MIGSSLMHRPHALQHDVAFHDRAEPFGEDAEDVAVPRSDVAGITRRVGVQKSDRRLPDVDRRGDVDLGFGDGDQFGVHPRIGLRPVDQDWHLVPHHCALR